MKKSNLILDLAKKANFFGKRLHDTKLELAENFVKTLELIGSVEPVDVLDWLEQNKPAQAKKASEKPAATTMLGQAQALADRLPVIKLGGYRGAVLTAAQNNTNVDLDAFSELKTFCTRNHFKLIVMPIHYNKNAFSSAVEDESEYYDRAVMPYLQHENAWLLGKGKIRLCSDARVSPTAKLPINAAQQLNDGEYITVLPHTKQQLRTLPRMPSHSIKEAWTTGTVTQRNYTESRAGSEAETDHVFGGVLIMFDDQGKFSATNLVVENGKLAENHADLQRDPVVVLGDLHCEVYDPECWLNTIAWLRNVNPALIVVHDILHFSTRSHHNRHSGKHIYTHKNSSVINDLRQVIKQINELAELTTTVYCCESNHNSALDNWLDDSSYRPQQDPTNSKLYYLLNWLICDTIDQGEDATLALKLALQNAELTELPELASNIVWGKMDESFIQNGVEFSQHGHKGQNGSAGNTALFSKWRTPLVTGHTHSPAIIGSVLTVGVTARMDQGYNRGGASSWAQSHGIVWQNGVRSIVPMNARG